MSLLVTLRERTREAHDRLEDQADVVHRAGDQHGYALLLRAFRSVYAPLEQALDASPATAAVVPDWPVRRGKTDWLDEDLALLGASPGPTVPLPSLTTGHAVAGAAYVMEGATLGGAVVLRTLDRALPRRFFTAYGADRGRMWRGFRQHLDALPLDEDAVVASAQQVFAAFTRATAGAAR